MDSDLFHEVLVATLSSMPVVNLLGIFAVMTAVLLHMDLDYLAFMALGLGGTPSTTIGFMKVKLLNFFALWNPYQPRPIPHQALPSRSYPVGLPERKGERPVTRGIAPHRQVTQKVRKDNSEKLSSAIAIMSASNETEVIGISCFEKHGIGLFNKLRTKRNEICHIHSSDGLMHMVLSDADPKIVLRAGWGERHPLFRGSWFEQFVPAGIVVVYAPQEETELETILRIVRAAAWYVGGEGGPAETSGQRRDSGYASAGES